MSPALQEDSFTLKPPGSPDTLFLMGFPCLEVQKMGDLACAVNLFYEPVSAASALNSASAAADTSRGSFSLESRNEARVSVTFRVSNSGFCFMPQWLFSILTRMHTLVFKKCVQRSCIACELLIY